MANIDPTGFTALAGPASMPDSISLVWDRPVAGNPSVYTLINFTNATQQILPGALTSYVVTGLSPGVYTFGLRTSSGGTGGNTAPFTLAATNITLNNALSKKQLEAGAVGVLGILNDGTLVDRNGDPVTAGGGGGVAVVNNLTSTSTTAALAAAQGKVLKDASDALTAQVTNKADVGHTHIVANLSDASTAGKDLLYAVSAANQRTLLGLGNVDNTPDASKPISTPTQAALNQRLAPPTPKLFSTAWAVSNISIDWMPSQTPSANVTLTADDTNAVAGGATACYFTPTVDISITTPSGTTSVAANTQVLVTRVKYRSDENARWAIIGGSSSTGSTTPTAPVITSVSSTSSLFTFTWTDGAGSPFTARSVDVSWDNSLTWVPLSTALSAGSNSVSFTPEAGARVADLRFRATNSAGAGIYTYVNDVSVPGGNTVPGAPTGLTLGAVTGTSQVLTWTAPASNGGSAITDYVVQFKLTSSGTWSTFADGVSTATTATVTGLTASTSYDYRVYAVNAVGQSASPSSVVTGSTAAAPPALVGTPLRSLAYTDVAGALVESGDFATGYTYTKTATGVYGNMYQFTKNGGGNPAATERLIYRITQGGTAGNWSLPVPTDASVDFSPGGGITFGNATGPVALDSLSATAVADNWSRGANWAARATITTGLYSLKIVSGTVRFYGTTDNGATWLEIAVYTKAAATAWGIYSSHTLFGTGQTLVATFSAS